MTMNSVTTLRCILCMLCLGLSCDQSSGQADTPVKRIPVQIRALGTPKFCFDGQVIEAAISSRANSIFSIVGDGPNGGKRLYSSSLGPERKSPRIVCTTIDFTASLAVTPDGSRAFVSNGRLIQGIDASNGSKIFQLKLENPKKIPRLVVSKSGLLLACWEGHFTRRTIDIINVKTGRLITNLRPMDRRVRECSFAGTTEKQTCVVVADGVSTWSINGLKVGARKKYEMPPSILAAACPTRLEVCFVLDSANAPLVLRRFDLMTAQSTDLGHSEWFTDVAYSMDGKRIGAISNKGLQVWDATSHELETTIAINCIPPPFRYSKLAFDESGRYVTVWGKDHRIRTFDLTKQSHPDNTTGHSSPVYVLQWADNDKRLFSGSRDARMWSLADGRDHIVFESKRAHSQINGLAVTRDARFLATSSYESNSDFAKRTSFVTVTDLLARKQTIRERQSIWPVVGTGFTSDSKSLIHIFISDPDGPFVAGQPPTDGVRIRSLQNGSIKHGIVMRMGDITQMHSAGDTLAVSTETALIDNANAESRDRPILIFSIGTGRVIARANRPYVPITCLTVSPTGKRVMAGFHDGIVQYWEAPKFTNGGRKQLHDEPVDCVAADASEKMIATVGRKTGKVRLWDFAT